MRLHLLVAALLLAGCSGGDDTPPPMTCDDGMEMRMVDGVEQCMPPLPPASTTVQDAPASLFAYASADITWVLNTYQEEAHAMRTELRVSTTAVAAASLGEPDAYGEKVGGAEHQNFQDGKTYTATFQPTEAGTYYLRSYALVDTKHIWSPQVTVNVSMATATGTVHEIVIKAGGPVASAEPAELDITIGDAVQFRNEDILPRTFTWSGPAEIDDQSVETLGSSSEVVFLVPGTYTFSSDDVQPITGTVSARVP